ncbi:hypothetical protein DY000_02059371 [Brassica cretica]|uniref:Uncharacterized protein n=1 Tax=Brassica cretica TaxID=69181 RepID=A0ABQ7B027_BRACR|nr:hypothetical protein DY000_02059371 [Brassica cretica]
MLIKSSYPAGATTPEIAATYPFRHKYNLAQKLWYEDKLRREYLKTSPNLKIAVTHK